MRRLSTHLQSSDAAYLVLFVTGFWHGRQAAMVLLMVVASALLTGCVVAGQRQGSGGGGRDSQHGRSQCLDRNPAAGTGGAPNIQDFRRPDA